MVSFVWEPEHDLLFVELSDAPLGHSERLDERRTVHYDKEGNVGAIHFLGASAGVDLSGLPIDAPEQLREWLAERNLKVA